MQWISVKEHKFLLLLEAGTPKVMVPVSSVMTQRPASNSNMASHSLPRIFRVLISCVIFLWKLKISLVSHFIPRKQHIPPSPNIYQKNRSREVRWGCYWNVHRITLEEVRRFPAYHGNGRRDCRSHVSDGLSVLSKLDRIRSLICDY